MALVARTAFHTGPLVRRQSLLLAMQVETAK
jgi:hypothetical protein